MNHHREESSPRGSRKKAIIPIENLGCYAIQEEYECVLLPMGKLEDPHCHSLQNDVYILAYTSFLMNNDESRDVLLNRICNTELTDLPINHVHLVLMIKDSAPGSRSGFKAFIYELHANVSEARKKTPGATPKRKGLRGTEYQWLSHSLRCGDARVYTNPDEFIELSQSAIMALLSARDT